MSEPHLGSVQWICCTKNTAYAGVRRILLPNKWASRLARNRGSFLIEPWTGILVHAKLLVSRDNHFDQLATKLHHFAWGPYARIAFVVVAHQIFVIPWLDMQHCCSLAYAGHCSYLSRIETFFIGTGIMSHSSMRLAASIHACG